MILHWGSDNTKKRYSKEEAMSKIDVDQTIRELEAGKTPEWITEHLRMYRESGGAEGHM